MSTLGIVVLILTAVYLAGLISYLPGIFRGLARRKKEYHELPCITILICARDEEDNIADCLHSVVNLDYPREKMEVLVVDDRSTDSTPDILFKLQKEYSCLHVLRTTEEIPGLYGKANALAQGMDTARGDLILMTDADCVIPKGWAKEHVTWYDNDTGMVSSMTSLKTKSLFDSAHSLEMVEVLTLSMAAINYDVPVSVIGNNLSIRKKTYDEIGGYRSIPFSVTEDVALFQAVWNSDKWKVKFKANEDIAVETSPPVDFRTWWRQKHRWVIGGKKISIGGFIILALGYVGVFVFVAAPFALDIGGALSVIVAKFVADAIILVPVLRSIGKTSQLLFFLFYQLYMIFFLLCVPILVLQTNVVWKGRVYNQ